MQQILEIYFRSFSFRFGSKLQHIKLSMLDGSLENGLNCKCGHNVRCPAINIPIAWGILHYHPTANENISCYDDRCDLSGSLTWFLLCRSQDTSICIQNFEHEKNMSGPAVRVGAGWPRKMPRWTWTWTWPPCNPRHRASGRRDENWSVFIGRFCWRGMLLVFLSSSFFPSGAGTSTCFLADGTLRVSCDQLCAQVSKYQDLLSIQHSGLKLPIKVLIPLLTPVLILPGCPSRNCSEELMMTWIQRLEA